MEYHGRRWSYFDWAGHWALLIVLATLCAASLDQHKRVRDLGMRLVGVEGRVTTANQRAWAPWSHDVTERLQRIETKVDGVAEALTP